MTFIEQALKVKFSQLAVCLDNVFFAESRPINIQDTGEITPKLRATP